jgi:hypothetical protein
MRNGEPKRYAKFKGEIYEHIGASELDGEYVGESYSRMGKDGEYKEICLDPENAYLGKPFNEFDHNGCSVIMDSDERSHKIRNGKV